MADVTTHPPPGALAAIIRLHAEYYSRHWSFGLPFEAKVAAQLGEFASSLPHPDARLFLAIRNDRVLGSVAIDGRDRADPRLRWFIVAEHARGGLGRRLLDTALDFARDRRFPRLSLDTFAGLDAARRLYEGAGFTLIHEALAATWGVTVTEQVFTLTFPPSPAPPPAGTSPPAA